MQSTALKYDAVRDAIEKAAAEIGAATADQAVRDVQEAIDVATKSDQGSKLNPDTVRRFLETVRTNGITE